MSVARNPNPGGTGFAVLHPIEPIHLGPVAGGAFRLKARHGVWLALIIVLSASLAMAQSADGRSSVFEVLIRWMPLLLSGFVFNLVISVAA